MQIFHIIHFLSWIICSSKFVSVGAAEGLNFLDFLMSSSNLGNQKISFSPDDGKKFRRSFESKYGPRGKLLIESMGQGTPAYISTTESIDKTTTGKSKQVLKIKKRIVKKTTTPSVVSSTLSVTTPANSSPITASTFAYRSTSKRGSGIPVKPKN